MGINYIPRFLLDTDDITTLKRKSITLTPKTVVIGEAKVGCYATSLEIDALFDKLESDCLWEIADENNRRTFASRIMAIMFLRVREVAQIKDKDIRQAAMCGLIAANAALYNIDPAYARRMLPLMRSI